MKIDNNLKYTSEHLWVNTNDQGEYLSGITDYAQDLLGDIVFVEFPEIGATIVVNIMPVTSAFYL